MTVADLIERYMSSFDETVALVYLLFCFAVQVHSCRRPTEKLRKQHVLVKKKKRKLHARGPPARAHRSSDRDVPDA